MFSLSFIFFLAYFCARSRPVFSIEDSSTCNGMREFCDLTLPQATFAGTHNSGAGFDGALYYHTFIGSIVALSCFYRNQDRSITQQLDAGIRYLDIDTCWESDDWWHVGAWSCHEGAYGGPIYKILDQVDAWMKRNRNEVVVIHFNRDSDDAEKTGPDIFRMIEDRWGSTNLRRMRKDLTVNDYRRREWSWPTLGKAVESNQRIFVFFDYNFVRGDSSLSQYYKHRWIHVSNHEIGMSWTPMGLIESKGCSKIVDTIRQKCAENQYSDFMEVDLILTWGLCTKHLADYCNDYIDQATRECAESRAKNARGTANFISVDWASRTSGRDKPRDVARRQNIRNVKFFLGRDVASA